LTAFERGSTFRGVPNTVEIKNATSSVAIVSLIGDHDLGEYETLKVALARAAIRAPNLVADLSRCAFIDSTVIGLLIHSERVVARNRGRLVVALPAQPSPVTRVAQLVHLSEVLPTYDSLDAALASFEQSTELGAPQPA
jgi:anti-anti-sigma factor